MKKLVIFDLDGTLLNTIDDLGNATNHALETCGFAPHSLASYPFFVGNGILRLIERALPEDARTKPVIDRVRAEFMKYYDAHSMDCTVPYQGIPELLSSLQGRGVALAVASNKYRHAVQELMRHYFPDIKWAAVEGQVEERPVKPDPSIVFEILSQHPTPKADVLYVGDSGVDMETARRACVESVGVTWGFRSVKELKDTYADNIVYNPGEILDIVMRDSMSL